MTNKNKIYYIAHPYSDNPEQSWNNACEWTSYLRNKGYILFSPILHTHPFHEHVMKVCQYSSKFLNKKFKYVEWDLDILNALMAGDGCVTYYCQDCGHSNVSDQDPLTICELCHQTMPPSYHYDSKLVVLLSKNAYEMTFVTGDINNWVISKWLSTGCEKEYEFAKKHYIQILELEAFLAGVETEL
jgi:hypothetical protein